MLEAVASATALSGKWVRRCTVYMTLQLQSSWPPASATLRVLEAHELHTLHDDFTGNSSHNALVIEGVLTVRGRGGKVRDYVRFRQFAPADCRFPRINRRQSKRDISLSWSSGLILMETRCWCMWRSGWTRLQLGPPPRHALRLGPRVDGNADREREM